ncbi:MAG TPA: hypothetical protein VI911_11245 [Patescibacteria group bacterium]|nr:hypothetical protein [Patescibacteria group bacterium]
MNKQELEILELLFLAENDALDSFEANFNEVEFRSAKCTCGMCTPLTIVDAGFLWYKSPEGMDYWVNINNELEEFTEDFINGN